MIVLTNTAAQTLTSGQLISFNSKQWQTGNGECYYPGSGSVKMRNKGIYKVGFKANVSGGTAGTAVQLAIAVDGVTLAGTTLIYTPASDGAIGNVYCEIPVRNCCCDFDRVSVINNGTMDITIEANPLFWVRRIA